MDKLRIFGLILISVVFVLIEGELPPTIKVCSRSDVNISACIVNSINHLRPYLVSGNLGENFKITPIEPFVIDQIIVEPDQNFRIRLRSLNVHGASNFKIEKLRVNVDDLKISVGVSFPKLTITGKYQVFIRILGFQFEGKGDLFVIFDKFYNRVHMKANKYRRNNIEFAKFEPMRVKSTPGLIRQLNVTNLVGNDVNLKDIANAVINSNSEFIINQVIPAFERNLADTFTRMSNVIADRIPLDELFSE